MLSLLCRATLRGRDVACDFEESATRPEKLAKAGLHLLILGAELGGSFRVRDNGSCSPLKDHAAGQAALAALAAGDASAFQTGLVALKATRTIQFSKQLTALHAGLCWHVILPGAPRVSSCCRQSSMSRIKE